MNEYKGFKREQKNIKNNLNNKAYELQNKSNRINDIIDNLKPTIMNKNNYFVFNVGVENIKSYKEQTNVTTSNLRDANDINIVLKKIWERNVNML